MSQQSRSTSHGRTRRIAGRAPAVLLTTALLVFAGNGAASAASAADPDPIGDLVKGVTDTVKGVTQPITKAANAGTPATSAKPAKDAGTSTSDDDSPGHETKNPQAPDHGSSHVNHTDVGGGTVTADASSTDAKVNDDDSSAADATLLAVNGMQVAGSKASSTGANEGHGPVPSLPLCDSSGGALCLDALYAESRATDDGTTSRSKADTGIADLCLGGSSTTTCNGPLDAGAGRSTSTATRDQATGRTTTTSSSSLADLCLARDAITGACSLQLGLLSADGSSDSDGATRRSSSVVTLAGSGIGSLALPTLPMIPGLPGVPGLPSLPTDPTAPFAVTVPDDDCSSATNLLCIFGNQGESYGLTGDAALPKGTAQTALDVSALSGLITTDLAHAETLAHNDGGRTLVEPPTTPPGTPPGTTPPGATGNPLSVTATHGILPNTGGVWSGLIGLGLLLFALGAVATAWDRRRVAA